MRAPASTKLNVERGLAVAGVGLAVLLTACGGDSGTGVTELTNPAACYAGAGAPLSATDVTVTLDASHRYQTMQGFGSTERLFDDPHLTNTYDANTKRSAVNIPAAEQAKILDALYVTLGLTRVRVHQSDDGDIEPLNDNGDPMVADMSKFDFSWKKSDGYITLIKSLVPRGVNTYFASPLALEAWMTEANPAEYAEWALVTLKYWRDRGVELPYYSIKNEPGYYPGRYWSGEFLRDATKLLGARIKAEGLKTKIVVPDDVNPSEAYKRISIILADPEARQYVGAIAYHIYGTGDEDKIKQLGEQYGIPIWMTEFFTTDAEWMEWGKSMHDLIANKGVSAVDYMMGYFGDWTYAQLVRVLTQGNTYAGFNFTRQYYVTGQYSRFVRPGAVRIGAESPDANVGVTAFVDNGKLIVVALNTGTSDRRVALELGATPSCVTKMSAVRTSATDSWLALPAISLDAPHFAATLPAGSITTFVSN